jgi:tripartite-type tricarboxylate transporter receptor subunit TctC
MKLSRRTFVHLAAGATALRGLPRMAWAQAYPTRPVTLLVPFAAGGSFDVIARVITPRFSELLGQQVIVENVGAAAGIVGVSRVAHATPDGYSMLLGTVGTHAYNPALYKKLPYNPAADFAPVGLIAEQPLVLIARKDFPPNTLPEFIAYAKANAANLQYGSAGVGSTTHLACALLNAAAGMNVTHIPLSRRRTGDGRHAWRPNPIYVLEHARRAAADPRRHRERYRAACTRSLAAHARARHCP